MSGHRPWKARPQGPRPRGAVEVGLGNVEAALKVKVEPWGARCRLSCFDSEITVDFHDDGGVEVVEPEGM